MILDDLIDILKKHDPEKVVRRGFDHPHSYRGFYGELAFEPASPAKVGDMLAAARGAVNRTYGGWKGGDFKMDLWTDCWIDEQGVGAGNALGPLLLEYMLNDEVEDKDVKEKR